MINTLQLIAGLVLLAAGAEALVRGSASLARRLRLTPLVIGLTVVAFGTSAPEMLVSVVGAWQGRGDIALGNVVGSNIFNVGLILGLTALIAPIRIRLSLLRIDAPVMVAVTIGAVGLAIGGTVPRWGGGLLLVLLVGFTLFSIAMARREVDAGVNEEFETGVPSGLRSPLLEVTMIVVGLVLLVVGSRLLVTASTAIAQHLGVGDAVIGLTIVAAGTSMPELATSLAAALRGQPDIAVGNVIGSNLFNILGILGASAVFRPLVAPGIQQIDLWVMLAFAIGLLPLLWSGRTLQRWEGLLLLAGYGAFLWLRWPAG